MFSSNEFLDSLLVVDDNSPDGTAEIVLNRSEQYGNIHLLTGEKAGLGAAYIRGMTHALNRIKADAVFEMDADYSHKPEDVPRMVQALDEGADFVIGSRYVRGGKIPDEWGIHRKMTSRVGNFVARYVAGINKVRDCTAGFRAIRFSLLCKVDLSGLRVQGYAFQVALLHEVVASGGRVKEIPVEFIDRTVGESKLGFSDILEFVINAWWIRYQSSRTFLKFATVGASGIVVNLGCFSTLLELGLNKYIASPIAIELSIIWNFLLNNCWTFGSRETCTRFSVKGIKFNLVSLLALGISYSSFMLLNMFLPQVNSVVHQGASIVPATLVNYFLNSCWTFRKRAENFS